MRWGIFVTNGLGSFLMGVLVQGFMYLSEPMPNLRAFLTVGVLGAFTTFSTFSLEIVSLLNRGHLGMAALYTLGSVCLAVLGLYAGMMLARAILG